MKINEIFYSIQGEGYFTGTAATFVRCSGCNLKCGWCDTDHKDGKEMTADEIVEQVSQYPARHVVITGGEPTLQLTSELVNKLHEHGFYIQLETNGTIDTEALKLIDWVTVSPKYKDVKASKIDEIKVVYPSGMPINLEKLSEYDCVRYLQPCGSNDEEETVKNIRQSIDYIKKYPQWKLSLQTQKILNVR